MPERDDDRFNDVLCCVCRRRAIGHGYTPSPSKPILWCCDDFECLTIARNTYQMKQEDFSRLESLAAGRGGENGGAYLDTIGKTDLATLTEAEWFEFCRRVVAGYRIALKTDLKEEPPF